MRIGLLCNDRIALPAVNYLLTSQLVVSIGMPLRKTATQTIVKAGCSHHHIPLHFFEKNEFPVQLNDWLKEYEPDVVLVMTFPYRIPADALAIPRYGFINFHYAPLPEWRGANPLFWMLRNNVSHGGVTVHQMNERYDEGPVLLQAPLPLTGNINFGIYYTQLSQLAVPLTVQLLSHIQAGTLQPKQQDHSKAGWYTHPKASDLFIDWEKMNGSEITSLVKACNPWNKGAATRWNGWTFGITYASVDDSVFIEASPGTIISIDSRNGFTIAAKDGKAVVAEVVYCEEGFYPGYCLSAFGLKPSDRLS